MIQINKSTKIVVLMGGESSEREISILSGKNVSDSLFNNGLKPISFDCKGDFIEELIKINPDVCFNALHGLGGEDGEVQSLLEKNNIPYTHSGVISSKLAMNKVISKNLFSENKINTPISEVIKINDLKNLKRKKPYVVKPIHEGSSNGVYVILNESDRNKVLNIEKSWIYGEEIIIEDYIKGKELSCAVFNGKATEVMEIKAKNNFYDFESKYSPEGSKHIIPANIPKEVYSLTREISLKCHEIFGCKGISRTDFRWDEDKFLEGLFVLEINTQPGMTSTSIVPELLKKEGISYNSLIIYLLEDASCDR